MGLALLVGAVLGPLALLIIFVLLAHGHLEFPGTFKGTGSLWAFSILVSTVSFGLYERKKSLEQPSRTCFGLVRTSAITPFNCTITLCREIAIGVAKA